MNYLQETFSGGAVGALANLLIVVFLLGAAAAVVVTSIIAVLGGGMIGIAWVRRWLLLTDQKNLEQMTINTHRKVAAYTAEVQFNSLKMTDRQQLDSPKTNA